MKLAAYSFAMLVALGLIFMMSQAVVPLPVTAVNPPLAVPVPDQPQGKTYKVTSSDQLTPAFVDIAHDILNHKNANGASVVVLAPSASKTNTPDQLSAPGIAPNGAAHP
jgi:hypothetical protein